MNINKSYLFAGFAILAIFLWFWVNTTQGEKPEPAPSLAAQNTETVTPTVVVERREASLHQNKLKLFGRTESNRQVDVKAKTAGVVSATPLREGQRVAKGTILCQQQINARQAVLDQARANMKSIEFDKRSTKILVDKGYRSAIQLTNIESRLDAARAQIKQAEVELNNVNMFAPFTGIFDSQIAQVGDFLAPGQTCGSVVELNPLIISTELTEKQVGKVKPGQVADIELITGELVKGKIQFIEANADETTRTFQAKISVPNPNYALKGGVTANIVIPTETIKAQNIPAKILTLNTSGNVGVRYVDDDDIVRFAETQTIDEEASGVWVIGLPENTRIIVEGQDYVATGTRVDPQAANYNTGAR